MFIIITLLKILIIVVPLLISVAYFTLAERKILGAIQRRRGPNVVGVYGLLQPLSDGFKLLVKETVLPSNSNKFILESCCSKIINVNNNELIEIVSNCYLLRPIIFNYKKQFMDVYHG